MSSPLLFSDVLLHISPEKFFLESPTQDGKRRILIIDRVSRDISLEDNMGQIPGDILSRESIAGIIGIINIGTGPALVIAKRKKKIGDITSHNHGIFQLTEADVLPFARSEHHLTINQQAENSSLVAMVKHVLSTPNFYFSHSTDLSNSLQRRRSFYPGQADLPPSAVSIFTQWDRRFVWNRSMLTRFLERGAEFLPYCLPLIHGAIFIRQCSLNGKLFRYTLLSRRSVLRGGTRFFMRGCDDYGNCANFVETEQLVETAESVAAFVQTRGSLPMFWRQVPNVVEYKPDPTLEVTKQHLDGYTKHFTEQIGLYGAQAMVNLVDHRKAEGVLEQHIRGLHHAASIPGVDYFPFDFHKECANFQWDRLHSLITNLQPCLQRFGHFLAQDGVVMRKQTGVFRTNCIDCLDRTNVVQSLLSTQYLQEVLTALKVLGEGQRISAIEHFQSIFRNVWADHGDLLSIQYAGTAALKTDFTRTGKRTVNGMFSDLHNSMVRYYKNNFSDGFRQDAIDFFLGNFVIDETSVGRSPYAKPPTTSWISYLPLILVISIAMVLLTVLFAPEFDQGIVLFLLFWVGFTLAAATLLHKNAMELVDVPKLVNAQK